jgi:2-methylcitrate dehydratase PrpD
MIGVFANQLAEAGFIGSRSAIGAAFDGLVGDLIAPEVLSAPVDLASLEICSNYFKLHSCCASSHSAIDAVLSLGRLDVDQIIAVDVETVTNNLKIARAPLGSRLSRRFSFPFAVAAALAYGHAGVPAFEPNEAVAGLSQRVNVRADPELESKWPDASPARVTVRMHHETISAFVENPRGHWRNPASADELRAKFERLSWADGPSRLYDAILAVNVLDDVGLLLHDVSNHPPLTRVLPA